MKFTDIPQMSIPGYRCDHLFDMLPGVIERYQKERPYLNLDPDFQRAHVWTLEQQSRYVEFLLQGGNSSRDIFLNCPGWMGDWKGPFEIVDGKQRLAACLGFLAGTVPIFGGHFRRDFTDRPFMVTLCFHINTLKTRQEVLQWYLDINSGGVVHTTGELDKVRGLLEAAQ